MPSIADLCELLTRFSDKPTIDRALKLQLQLTDLQEAFTSVTEGIDDLLPELETYGDTGNERDDRNDAQENATGYALDLISSLLEIA